MAIIFSLINVSYAISINKLSSKNTLIIDMTDNSRPDLILQWKNKTLIHHFIDNKNQKINISVKRVGKTTVKEFSKLIDKRWELYLREKYVKINDLKIKKEVERFNDSGESQGKKIYLTDKNQSSEVTLTPANIQELVLNEGEEFLSERELNNLIRASGNCKTLNIFNQGYQIDFDGILEKSYSTIDLKKFFNIEGCEKGCDEKNVDCLNKEEREKFCGQDLGSVVMDSIKDNLTCLNTLNPAIGAQLAGLIFYNKIGAPDPDKCVFDPKVNEVSGCKKIKLKCASAEDMRDSWGTATQTCHPRWPAIKLSRMMCHQEKFIGPVSMAQTFFHESIHLLGYAHGEDPEMAYACTLACGSINEVDGKKLNIIDNKVKKHRLYQNAVQNADDICRSGLEVSGDYKDKMSIAMSAYGKASLYDKYRSFQFNPEDYNDVDGLFNQELNDARLFNDVGKPVCKKVYRVDEGQDCIDNYGNYRAKWIHEDVLGKPSSTSLVNILMFGDRQSKVLKSLTETMFAKSLPQWYDSEKIDEEYTDNFDLLKKGAGNLMKRLEYIGDNFKKYDYQNVVEKMTDLYREIKHRPKVRLFTEKAIKKGVNKRVLAAIKSLMVDYCIRNEDELKMLPVSTKARDMAGAIESCEKFKYGDP